MSQRFSQSLLLVSRVRWQKTYLSRNPAVILTIEITFQRIQVAMSVLRILGYATAIFLILQIVTLTNARPQGQQAAEKPEPYEYTYEVKDAEKELFHNKNENGDAQGKVSGQYSVWLPDGRLMTVSYTVDGENGFVPKITFDTNNPLG